MVEASLTERLARWLSRWRESGLPQAVLETSQGYLLDWLGSALAGTATGPGAKLLDYAQAQPSGPCGLVGSGLSRSAEVAAMVNGGLSHIVEMDDVDRGSVVHPGAVVIPAALAVAQREDLNGRDFLSAVVAGYEVAIRVGEAVGKRHYYYFHNTGTCGVFGAAAAAGWLLGLTQNQLVWALGNAGTQSSGLWEFNADGAMTKHLHTGRAAAGGVLAADLAARGFTGPRRILDGERGLFAATAPDAAPERVVDGLDTGSPIFKIGGVSIKPHASCRHTHPAIDLALTLRSRLQGRSVDRVEIDTYQAALELCDDPEPRTPYAAQFSLQYCVALALERGHVTLEDFTPASMADPAVSDLLPRISAAARSDLEAHYPLEWPARIRLMLEGGESLNGAVTHPKGDPESPLTRQELEEKFRMLASYGKHTAHADGLLSWVSDLIKDAPVAHAATA